MVAFESITNDTYASSKTSSSAVAPTGVALGDTLVATLILVTGFDPEGPTSIPDGWTIAPGTWPLSTSGVGFFLNTFVYLKTAGAADVTLSGSAGSYTWAHDPRSSQLTISRLSGVDTSTPLDVAASQNVGTGATVTWLGLETVTPDALLLAIEWDFGSNTDNTVAPSGSTPTFTERLDVPLTYVASGVLGTPGTTGNKTHTSNSASGEPWLSVLLAFRPAGEAVAPTNTEAPAVTGTPQVGETLTCDPGEWDGTEPITYEYQWQRLV